MALPMDMIICGDSADVLKELPDCSVDLVATDPPYGIAFMASDWDREIPARAIWSEVLRVLKPGASCFVCAGARQDTLLGMLTDLREVGFEIEHSALTWVFANGAMPKSSNVGKDIDKAAFREWCKEAPEGETASRADLMGWTQADLRKAASAAVNGEAMPITYRPAQEADWFFGAVAGKQARSVGTLLLTALVSRFGDAPGVRVKVGEVARHYPDAGHWGQPTSRTRNGPFNPQDNDDLKVATNTITAPATPDAVALDGWHSGKVPLSPRSEILLWVTKPSDCKTGREQMLKWNVGAVNVEAARVPFEEGGVRDGHWGGRRTGGDKFFGMPEEGSTKSAGRYPSNLLITARALGDWSKYCDLEAWSKVRGLDADWLDAALQGIVRVAKPSKSEKNRGCEGLEEKPRETRTTIGLDKQWIDRKDGRGVVPVSCHIRPRANNHPTCKPVTLMAYLIALACPTGGLVLDPFVGSGTTLVAAAELGMRYIGIDLDAGYCEIARARVAAVGATQQPQLDLAAAG